MLTYLYEFFSLHSLQSLAICSEYSIMIYNYMLCNVDHYSRQNWLKKCPRDLEWCHQKSQTVGCGQVWPAQRPRWRFLMAAHIRRRVGIGNRPIKWAQNLGKPSKGKWRIHQHPLQPHLLRCKSFSILYIFQI